MNMVTACFGLLLPSSRYWGRVTFVKNSMIRDISPRSLVAVDACKHKAR